MAVLYASNSLIHFGGSPTSDGNASNFDTSKYDYAIIINDDTTLAQQFPHDESSTDITVYQWDYKVPINSGSSEDGYFMDWRDTGGNLVSRIDVLNGTFAIKAYGNSVVTDSYSSFISAASINKMKVTLTVTATDVTASLVINGAFITSATVSNTNGNVGKPVTMNFAYIDSINGGPGYASGILVTEEDIGNLGFVKLKAASIGTDADLVGTVANVSDDNLLTGVIADATNEKISFNMETFSGANLIKSYVTSAVLSAGESAPSNYRFYLLIGGVQYPGATQSINSNTTQFVREEWTTDPSDGLPWTEAKINAAQVGIEVL